MPVALLRELHALQNNGVSSQIAARYNDFKSFASRGEEDWFSEICFCLTTANSSAEMGIRVQEALGFNGFYNMPQQKLARRLKGLGYRFYNKRAEYIVQARKHFGIKEKLNCIEDGDGAGVSGTGSYGSGSETASDRAKRSYLVENVKGFGLKEASHFLRNTGHDNCAILDRHILRIMNEHGLITKLPNSLSQKNYLEFESVLDGLAKRAGMSHSLLDLYLWYMRTGKVLK